MNSNVNFIIHCMVPKSVQHFFIFIIIRGLSGNPRKGFMTNKLLVFIPTYNECNNIQPLYHAIKNLNLNLDFLFLDDNSPDGTGCLLNEIQKKDACVFIIHRKKKSGIGSAHKEGIAWAYANGYQQLITMDADFSHDPKYIPALISALDQYDIAIGSRFLMKNSLETWNYFRKALTWTAHLMTAFLLKCPYDVTGAYRAYQLSHIDANHFSNLKSSSYAFFFESLKKLFNNRYKIIEIPINLPARTYGNSKMSFLDAFKSLVFLFKLYKDAP